ncbi:MAG: nicotinate (nicotinamide) nucleotide adenylyltransferase [Acidobacteriaceae bacterium]|jgi:nicotinate-nucleotide adenylyltransferase
MRIAFFGGTFDPPHCGHIAIARAAITRLAIDQVLVAPVGTQPLKGGSGHSSFEDRLAMVKLAVAGDPGLSASDIDAPLPSGQPNYTFDTLQRLRSHLQPADVLFFLLGADSFLTLRQWHQSTELLLFCDFIVAGRPGFSLAQINAALPEGVKNTGGHPEAGYTRFTLSGPSGRSARLFVLPDLDQDISATEIRAALAEGAEQQTVLAPAVAEYIRSHGLYRPVGIP